MPPEDQGYIFGNVQLPDGATLERTRKVAGELGKIAQSNAGVQNVIVINGFDLLGGGNKTNAATMFIPLKHWDERKDMPAAAIAGDIARTRRRRCATAWRSPSTRRRSAAWAPPAASRSTCRRAATRTRSACSRSTQAFLAALREHPQLTGINSFFRPTVPQLRVEVDREKALSLGVPVQDVFDALQSTMGALYVNDFNKFGRTYRVQMQADAPYRAQPEDLGAVYVRSTTTREMIPLKALIAPRNVVGPGAARALQRLRRRARARQRPARACPRARRSRAVEETAARALPEGYQIAWTGQAFQEKRTGRASAIAFALAIVMVFLILAALYERWLLPFAVVLAVPFAVLGALAFVCDARPGERHLLPDRPGGADRPRGEERDPDRRVRAAGLPRGQERRSRRRSTPRGCASGRS